MDAIKKAMIAALKTTYGRVTKACEIVDIARSTHYLWTTTDEEYKQAVDDVNEAAIDHVESKLFDLIDGALYETMTEEGIVTLKDKPSATAAIFYLKTKGKGRGYVERQELAGVENAPINIITNHPI